jgi:DNA-binding GntR family transcriptional regulator
MSRRIDHRSRGRALYLQLADYLRNDIRDGTIPAGDLLPSIPRLQQEYDLGRDAVRRGLAVLVAEGLIEVIAGVGSMVRDQDRAQVVAIQAGDEISARMPDPQESADHDMPPGVPLLVVTRRGKDIPYPANRVTLRLSK